MGSFKVVTLHPHSSKLPNGRKKWRNRWDEYDFEGSKTDLDLHKAAGILAEKKEAPDKGAAQEKLMDNLEKKGKGGKARAVKKGTYKSPIEEKKE